MPVGAGGLYALAATGGSKDSTVVSHTHTATSTVTDPTHRHLSPTGDEFASFGTSGSAIGPSGARTDGRGFTSNSSTGVTVATTVASAGSSGTDANMPPYLAINFIIKT